MPPRRPSLAEVLKQQQSYQPTPEAAQQQNQQQQQRPAGPSQPRPHPFYLRPQHIKTNYKCPTSDGWRLHLVRTKQLVPSATRFHPVILCPGLGSSGAYTFDLSPNVSLADYLASNGWDVWTVELRGEGVTRDGWREEGRGGGPAEGQQARACAQGQRVGELVCRVQGLGKGAAG